MAKNGHPIKLLAVLISIALVLNCITLLKPASVVAEEARATMTHEERIQYNLITVVQRRLIAIGYEPGPVNGINGPLTQEAIKNYQRDNGLIVDGIPGPKTLKSLGY
jgi:peptidoglycan hydrolase-like protein with peptidoglycan-binding domain